MISIFTVELLALPPDPLKASASFSRTPALRAIFEEHPAKRRQQAWRELGIQGGELRAPRQLEDLLAYTLPPAGC